MNNAPSNFRQTEAHKMHDDAQKLSLYSTNAPKGAAPLKLAACSKPLVRIQFYRPLEHLRMCVDSGKQTIVSLAHCQSIPTALSSTRMLPPAASHDNFGCSNTGRILQPPKEPYKYASPKPCCSELHKEN